MSCIFCRRHWAHCQPSCFAQAIWNSRLRVHLWRLPWPRPGRSQPGKMFGPTLSSNLFDSWFWLYLPQHPPPRIGEVPWPEDDLVNLLQRPRTSIDRRNSKTYIYELKMFETSPTPHKYCDGSSGRQGHKQITQIKLDLLQVWHSLGLVHWWLWVPAESGMLFRNTPFTPCKHVYKYTEHLDMTILYQSISFYNIL